MVIADYVYDMVHETYIAKAVLDVKDRKFIVKEVEIRDTYDGMELTLWGNCSSDGTKRKLVFYAFMEMPEVVEE